MVDVHPRPKEYEPTHCHPFHVELLVKSNTMGPYPNNYLSRRVTSLMEKDLTVSLAGLHDARTINSLYNVLGLETRKTIPELPLNDPIELNVRASKMNFNYRYFSNLLS